MILFQHQKQTLNFQKYFVSLPRNYKQRKDFEGANVPSFYTK